MPKHNILNLMTDNAIHPGELFDKDGNISDVQMKMDSLFSSGARDADSFREYFINNPNVKAKDVNQYASENFGIDWGLNDDDLRFASTFDFDPRNPKFVGIVKSNNPKAYPDKNREGTPSYIKSVKPATRISKRQMPKHGPKSLLRDDTDIPLLREYAPGGPTNDREKRVQNKVVTKSNVDGIKMKNKSYDHYSRGNDNIGHVDITTWKNKNAKAGDVKKHREWTGTVTNPDDPDNPRVRTYSIDKFKGGSKWRSSSYMRKTPNDPDTSEYTSNYAPGGPTNDGPLGSHNLTGLTGVSEKFPAYGDYRQKIEESGGDLGSMIRERGFSDENLGEAPPGRLAQQAEILNTSLAQPVSEYAKDAPYQPSRETWTPRTSRGRGMLMEGMREAPQEGPQNIQKRSIWDFLKTGRRREKESGNKFFDMTGRERREARKEGLGWKNEYWDDPNADTQRFRFEKKGKRFGPEGKFSLFGNISKGGSPNMTPPVQMPMF